MFYVNLTFRTHGDLLIFNVFKNGECYGKGIYDPKLKEIREYKGNWVQEDDIARRVLAIIAAMFK